MLSNIFGFLVKQIIFHVACWEILRDILRKSTADTALVTCCNLCISFGWSVLSLKLLLVMFM